MWYYLLWYYWKASGNAWWPFLGNTAQKNPAVWTLLLREGPSHLMLTSALVLQMISEKKGRFQTASLTWFLLTYFPSILNLPTGVCLGFFVCISVKYLLMWRNAFISLRARFALHIFLLCTGTFAADWRGTALFAKCLHEQISPLCLLVSLPNWSFPGAKWSSLREKTIWVLLMLGGIKFCSWELISVLLLSYLGSGVGFVAVPGKLAEAAGAWKSCWAVAGAAPHSSYPIGLCLFCVGILCLFCVRMSEKQLFSCRHWQ